MRYSVCLQQQDGGVNHNKDYIDAKFKFVNKKHTFLSCGNINYSKFLFKLTQNKIKIFYSAMNALCDYELLCESKKREHFYLTLAWSNHKKNSQETQIYTLFLQKSFAKISIIYTGKK